MEITRHKPVREYLESTRTEPCFVALRTPLEQSVYASAEHEYVERVIDLVTSEHHGKCFNPLTTRRLTENCTYSVALARTIAKRSGGVLSNTYNLLSEKPHRYRVGLS